MPLTLYDTQFIVMFRSRFCDAFHTKLPQMGPQDIEKGVVDQLPSPQVESLLCALLGLVLNRKKYVESVIRSICVVCAGFERVEALKIFQRSSANMRHDFSGEGIMAGP